MLTHGSVRFPRSSWATLVAAFAVTIAGMSCQKMPLVAPSGTAITAVLIEGALGAGEAAETVAGGGTPVHNGTLVTFTTTLGRIEPAEARTTAGRALVRLVADGRSGVATITAFSGAATETLEVNIGAAGAARISVTASPQSLAATGGQAVISARVQDQSGNGLLGVPVSFSTTRGSLSSTTGISNDQGVATTTLSTTQEATVTATAGGGTAEGLTATVQVTLKPRNTVAITAPSSATVGVPASFTFTPGTGSTITEATVEFGDGGTANLRELASATQLSHAFRRKGIMDVTVRATDSEGATSISSTQVSVAPLAVSLAFTPSSATTPQVGQPVTFTATVSTGAIVQEYQWNFGDGQTRTTTSNRVTHTYGAAGPNIVSVSVVPIDNGDAESDVVVVDVKP